MKKILLKRIITKKAIVHLGAFIVNSFSDLNWKQLHRIGWCMNSRGAVELVIALLALKVGLLTKPLYSAIVIMTLLTTLVFPFVLRYIVNKDPKVMG